MSREAMQMALHTLEGWANYGKSNNSEWQQDRAKQVLAQMRGVEL